ncbi:MAG: hypothetical protein H8E29_17440 [Anaerolineales bacterium]|uniref:Uncharacterized protein n=1 Tax=Candidatus Desulfolinea nitratireducens TaxID=2841698 RepID=A0A8J6NIK8_9CHLR|nr:hypothetical protein [Candidatus Desulfolinea nitratireducens]
MILNTPLEVSKDDEEEGSPSQDGNSPLTPASLRLLPLSRMAGEGGSSETRTGEGVKIDRSAEALRVCHHPTTFPSK